MLNKYTHNAKLIVVPNKEVFSQFVDIEVGSAITWLGFNSDEAVVVVHMPTFIISVAVTCVVFSVVYMIVYKITSREYYNIVNG